MNKSSTNRRAIFISAILFFVCLKIFTRAVYAEVALDYYKNLFESWGIYTDTINETVPQKNVLSNSGTDSASQEITVEYSIPENAESDQNIRYLMVLASQTNSVTTGYKNIIYICDTTRQIAKTINCTQNSLNNVNFLDLASVFPSEKIQIAKIIEPKIVEGSYYYIIPQVLLTTPGYHETLSNYFKAVSRANSMVKETIINDESSTSLNAKLIKESPFFESIFYVLAIFMFIFLAKGLIITIASNPKILLNYSYHLNLLRGPLKFLQKYREILIFIFLLLAVFYLLIIYGLFIKGKLLGDSSYLITYFLNTFDPYNFSIYIMSKNTFRLGLLMYTFLFILFGMFLAVPSLLSQTGSAVRKLQTFRLKDTFVKWLVVTPIFLSMVLLVFFDFETILGYLSAALVFLLATMLYIKRRDIDYEKLFKYPEIRLIFFLSIAILAAGIIFPIYKSRIPIRYSFESLIGVQSDIVVLPYQKEWGKNTLFNPQYYKGTNRIYADNYLIYAPNVKLIINKPFSEFKDEGNYIVEISELTDYLSILQEHPDIKYLADNSSFSTLIAFDNSNDIVKNYEGLRAQVTLDCLHEPDPGTLELLISSLDAASKLDEDSIDLLNFPGCNPDEFRKIIEVPVDLQDIPKRPLIMGFKGIDSRTLVNFKLLAKAEEIPLTFLENERVSGIQAILLHSQHGQTDTITLYSNKIKVGTSQEIMETEDGYDISSPINDLMKLNILSDPFTIWSEVTYEIIKDGSSE